MLAVNGVFDDILDDESCKSVEATKATKTKVLAQIRRFQERIRRHIDDNYVDFMPNNASSDLYLEQGEKLVRSAERLLTTTTHDASVALIEANTELDKLAESLNEAYLGLRVSCRVLQIDNMFQCIDEAITSKELPMVIILMEKLKTLIYSQDDTCADVDRVLQRCACYEAIKVKYHIQTNLLQQNLQNRFEQLVQFKEKQFPQAKCIIIAVSRDIEQLQEITTALFQLRQNISRMSNFLMEQCFEPIIMKPVSLTYEAQTNGEGVESDKEHDKLTLSYTTKTTLSNNLRPTYAQVFGHIRQVLDCLNSMNVAVDDNQHIFGIIGDHIKQRLLHLLVDECLMHSIPHTIEEFEQSQLVKDVLDFEHYLADCYLLQLDNDEDRVLTHFADNFEEHFRNHFSRELIQAANKIMQKDLQDMTLIAEKHANEDISNRPLLFPRCMVSKSALELNKLLEQILRQSNTSEQGGDAVDNYGLSSVIIVILKSYVMHVPKLHEKLLESIPQQSALFYNNCMFLAHWVALHGEHHVAGFPALVKTLQSTGNKYLNVQINYQQNIIMNILKELDLNDAHTIGSVPHKLLRQCLRQLELLRNVWQNVLPESIYNKTFCQMLHDFSEELLKRIQALEDISATVANELSELIDIILQKAPTLFKEPHEVVHIKSWQKLEQLKLILNGSLLEIVELWCEGAGPLTANYNADEVRHLIRALFQNTDRRANALAKIC